ncbi:MAG: AsmA family protein, partial [Bryobacteraceae bacterium]
MPRWMKRGLLVLVLAVVAAGVGAPFLRADYFRQRIQEALERGLGRKVEVGAVHYTLFTGPGFSVSQVIIHDDPRVGIEPLAYVDSLDARVHPASLWSGRLEFSSLRLSDTTVNLIKPDDGPWNFQRLVERSAEQAGSLPPIYLRSSRVNFKFGDTKTVVYFRDADLDVVPGDDGRIAITFAGDPGRTDRAQQGYGRITANGSWRVANAASNESQLDLLIELERSSIPEIAHLLDGQDLGVQGVVSTRARVAGFVSNLQISGRLQVEDLRRNEIGARGGNFKVPYKGTLDLRGEKLALETESPTPSGNKKGNVDPPPVSWRVAGAGLMTKPHWEASVEMKELPAASFVEIAQHLGLTYSLPDAAVKAVIDGKLDGSISYSTDAGFRGQVVAQDALMTLPGAQPIRLRRGELVVDNQQWRI